MAPRTCLSLRRPLLTMALLLAVASPALHAADLKVFIMAGQSNMVGSGDVNGVPVSQATLFPEVLYTQSTNTWTDPVDPDDPELNDLWGPLQPRFNGNQQSGGTYRRWFGPELVFGETLSAKGLNDIAIIKYARNGTSLTKNWCPADAPCPENGGDSLRPAFYSFVDNALAELTNLGHTYDVEGFVWVQGSGDAGVERFADAYDAGLAQFVGEIEGRYGELTTVINRYHVDSNRTFTDNLRASQREFADADPNAYVIHTDDLALKSDNIHFSTPTHLEVGRRLADAYLRSLEPAGDFNRDGVVDARDYATWRDSHGSLAELNSDGDGDGVVDADDLAVWRDGYAMSGVTSAAAITPEPAAALVVAIGMALVEAVRRRHSPRETPSL